LGLLDPKGLPTTGADTARKVLDPSLPSNTLMAAWTKSDPDKK
jgi:carboxymethylenebutenolidase